MIKIKVNKREIELILLSYRTMQAEKNFAISEDESFVIIEGDEENNLDLMFNYILDTFLKIGLQPDSEPNELGMELENLNERINHEFVARFGFEESKLTKEEKQKMRAEKKSLKKQAKESKRKSKSNHSGNINLS